MCLVIILMNFCARQQSSKVTYLQIELYFSFWFGSLVSAKCK